jgi:transposase, IS5 family
LRTKSRDTAVEPVIRHLKDDHRMDRNYLAGRAGDAANAILAAVGYNFRLLLVWLEALLCALLALLFVPTIDEPEIARAAGVGSSRTTR